MATVFLNGRFTSRDEALIPAFDAGFQHGVGLFETMLAVRTGDGFRTIHAREHLERLAASALQLGLSDSLRVAALEEAVRRTVEKAGEELPDQKRLRVRLTITGGDLSMLGRPAPGTSPSEGVAPTLLIVAQPATEYPAEMFDRGAAAVLADLRINPLDPFQGHKTLNYWPRLRELQNAAAKRVGEALVFQVTNHLAGGCVSNAFLVRAGTLYTPIARSEEQEVARGQDDDERAPGAAPGAVMPSPVLPGIVRRWVLDFARAEGLDVERRMLTIDDVLAADELFLTNSSWGVLPIVQVESRAIGAGRVGEVSRRLMDAWQELAG
jgi:branched-subunit amino acid aminotransferase/4-amino-4-deoxychorismate lyase